MAQTSNTGTEQVKDRILSISTEIFAEYGFAGAPIRQIAKQADISIPSIYHHFGDKEALYSRVCASCMAKNSRRYRELLSAEATPEFRLLSFLQALCHNLFEDRVHARLLQRMFIDSQTSGLDRISSEDFDKTFTILVDVVQEISDHQNPRLLAFSLYSLAVGLMQMQEVYDSVHAEPLLRAGSDTVVIDILENLVPHIDWLNINK